MGLMHDCKQFDTLYVPEYGMTVLHEPCRTARLGHDYVMLAASANLPGRCATTVLSHMHGKLNY